MGMLLTMVPELDGAEEEPVALAVGAMFVAMGLVFFFVAQTFAALKIYAGYSLLRKRRRIACLVIGGITCLGVPYSTVLGVFTFIVLLRDSVRDLFQSTETQPAARRAGTS